MIGELWECGTIRVIRILAKEEMDVVDKWFDGTYTKNYK